jgi:hypothetical protein
VEAISIFENNLDEDEERLLDLITELTDHDMVAFGIHSFIPIAYCRVLITGPQYSDEYVICKSENDKTSYLFSSDRLYCMILSEYQQRALTGLIKPIGQYSAELVAISEAVKNGAELSNLSSGPMLITL